MTEEHTEKAIGSMQEGWSDRKAFRKSGWVKCKWPGVTEELAE